MISLDLSANKNYSKITQQVSEKKRKKKQPIYPRRSEFSSQQVDFSEFQNLKVFNTVKQHGDLAPLCKPETTEMREKDLSEFEKLKEGSFEKITKPVTVMTRDLDSPIVAEP